MTRRPGKRKSTAKKTIKTPPRMQKWDTRFIRLCQFASKWSKDPKARVGAAVVSERGGAISLGYNGFPKGVEDSAERLQNQAKKLKFVVHAEQNALISAGPKAEGATIYVWGKPVCATCAGAIIQAGIKRVVALSPDSMKPRSKWRRDGKLALEMFNEAKTEVDFYAVKRTRTTSGVRSQLLSSAPLDAL